MAGSRLLNSLCVCAIVLMASGCGSCNDVRTTVLVGESTGTPVYAIGAEFDPHFLSQNVTRIDESKREDWEEIIVRRLDMMRLSSFRVMVLPSWYEKENDNDDPNDINWSKFTFETPEMHSLYSVLDYAESRGVKVTLTLWGASSGNWLAGKNHGNWVVAPADYYEWAENFSALVQYLLFKKHYSCITQITPMNEPDWEFFMDGKAGPSSEYLKMCRILDKRFRADGIRDRVLFNLSDNSDGGIGTHRYLEDCVNGIGDISDVFNSHAYIFGYETPDSVILEWEKKNVALAASVGKKHIVGEFGGNQCEGSARQRDIDWYERGILLVRIAINALNAGASGVSYWSLLDQYYYREGSYESMQQLGLWRYVKNAYSPEPYYDTIPCDYSVRPQYYSYGLLTQFVRPGASVHPLDLNNQFVTASAINNEDGTWVYVFANQTDISKEYRIDNTGVEGDFSYYRYKEDELPSNDSMLSVRGTIKVGAEGLDVDIPAKSVVFYVENK